MVNHRVCFLYIKYLFIHFFNIIIFLAVIILSTKTLYTNKLNSPKRIKSPRGTAFRKCLKKSPAA